MTLTLAIILAGLSTYYYAFEIKGTEEKTAQEEKEKKLFDLAQSKITSFEGTGTYIAQQHTKKMTDYFEIYEVDDDDVRMKVFVQSLTGDVRTWFRALPANSINDPQALYQTFLNRWEKKKDPLHILSEYENLRRGTQETVQDYCTRFNSIYNDIPHNLRPPLDLV